jgi:hypothetical protein
MFGIKGFNTYFAAESDEFLLHIFRESSRNGISNAWMSPKKNPASRKVRERDDEREDKVLKKISGFR